MEKLYAITQSSLDELGMRLHTALRKVCDSTWTSVAYNAISAMPSNEWDSYIQHLIRCNSTVHSFSSNLLPTNFKRWSESWPHATPIGQILKTAFQNFDPRDWDAYLSYITLRRKK